MISVLGMTCESCIKLIEARVSKIKGVSYITASLQHNEVAGLFVEYNSRFVNIDQITATICDSGFNALPLIVITRQVTNPGVRTVWRHGHG